MLADGNACAETHSQTQGRRTSPHRAKMLVTMLTAMYVMVRAMEQLSMRLGRQPDARLYMLTQPIPWQIHSVTNGRKFSRGDELLDQKSNGLEPHRKDSNCSNGLCPPASPEVVRAASTIQKEYRKYQQKKKDA